MVLQIERSIIAAAFDAAKQLRCFKNTGAVMDIIAEPPFFYLVAAKNIANTKIDGKVQIVQQFTGFIIIFRHITMKSLTMLTKPG